MLKNLPAHVVDYPLCTFAITAVSIAFFRYVVPTILAALAIAKGRSALIRSTKQGIEIITEFDVLNQTMRRIVETTINESPSCFPIITRDQPLGYGSHKRGQRNV